MKTLTKIALIAAGLMTVATVLPVLHAADDTAAPAGKRALAGKHPRLRALMQRKAMRQRIAQRMGLSADQKTQLKATRASTVEAVKAIRADKSLSPEQKKTKLRETLQAARTTARGALNADQQARLGKLREQMRERIKARRGL